jgi:hypothetical protein
MGRTSAFNPKPEYPAQYHRMSGGGVLTFGLNIWLISFKNIHNDVARNKQPETICDK